MNWKKTIAAAALCIAFGVSGVLSAKITALDENYEASEAYKESKYYENLKSVALGGDGRTDVIAVALSQLGYHEGNGNDDLGGMNAEGEKDFAEFNVLFGELDNNQGNGKSYGYSWCASFASWCLRHAGVSEEQSAQTDPKTNRSSWQWRRAFIEAEQYEEKAEYVPQMGDIVFFKDVDDPSIEVAASHVGIVLYSDGANVHVIEGNTNATFEQGTVSNCVAVKSYSLDSKYIVGYGLPKYENASQKELLGWRVDSSDSAPKPLEELYEEMRAGKFIRAVWEGDLDSDKIKVFEIIKVVAIFTALAAGIAVLAIAVFGKKKKAPPKQ